jgi:hypothetical protein
MLDPIIEGRFSKRMAIASKDLHAADDPHMGFSYLDELKV